MNLSMRQARRLADKSQQDMADALNVSLSTYRKIEKFPEKTTIERAKKISLLLGVDYDAIFFGKESSFTGMKD